MRVWALAAMLAAALPVHAQQAVAGPRLPGIRKQFERASEPKQLLVLDGDAHAQFLFQTDQGDRLKREILRFLEAK